MSEIVEWIDDVLSNPEDSRMINTVREKVNETMRKFPLFSW